MRKPPEPFLNRAPRPLSMWVSLVGLAWELPFRHVVQLGLDLAGLPVKTSSIDPAVLIFAFGTLSVIGGYRTYEKRFAVTAGADVAPEPLAEPLQRSLL